MQLYQVVKDIADGLRGGPANYRNLHERNFDTREDFEAAAKQRPAGVIVYSTKPLELENPPPGHVIIQLPEVDDLDDGNPTH